MKSNGGYKLYMSVEVYQLFSIVHLKMYDSNVHNQVTRPSLE